jgi:nucleotide-binding universal stress UspA family protein
MERFKNILLVVNSQIKNSAAIKCAITLARKNEARLKIVDIIKETSHYQPILPGTLKDINLHDILVQEKRDLIERLSVPFLKGGPRITIKILTGIPFLEIIREVISKDHDLVIITPEGKSEFKDMLFGTTTMNLMRKCPCPVWAIKPSEEVRFSRILAAVDPDPSHKESHNLNGKILEMASSLAEMQGSKLIVVHTWDFHIRSGMLPQKAVDEMASEVKNMHKSWFDDLLKKFVPDLPESQRYMIMGEAGVEIPRFSREKQIDLIIMGTVSRTGIPGLIIGNTAEKVLYRVNCSVLAVKPAGFISSVSGNV